MDHKDFDFIIIGAGPAGCALAAILARARTHPSVLLLEAGCENTNLSLRIDGERQFASANKAVDWGYSTVPQEHLGGRTFPYPRGKGLGGSSVVNYEAFTVGPKDDYDEWAERVGDPDFSWKRMQTRFRRLETYHGPPKAYQKYVNPHEHNHGQHGDLQVGFPPTWEKDLPELLDIFEKIGVEMNDDINSGNPIGMGVSPNSAFNGTRSTAADLLQNAPPNLVIKTDTPVTKVIFKDSTALGVETEDKKSPDLASKDVILSAGAFDTPKILMHSGIGPADELQNHGIPVVHDLPFVGKNLRDHLGCFTLFKRANETSDRGEYFSNPSAIEAAKEQWLKDRTGPLSLFGCTMGMGFFKSDSIYSSKEFCELPKEQQRHLRQETVPVWEAFSHLLFPQGRGLEPTQDYWALLIVLLNLQSTGEVRLQSSDPAVPLLYDFEYLSHPYDQRIAIEAGRAYMGLINSSEFQNAIKEPFLAPKSESQEDIMAFFKGMLNPVYHAMGTVKMGKKEDPETCVDNTFSVQGVKNLRVADMSIAPLLFNNHPQSTAYVTGMTLADKLIDEYKL
ncbi:putative glucose dehydrogenase [Rhizodiscina lignyota]|uniref:Glucose dehydrogenase n=1 Tax=Rhizodiscina lignyota TaxID=1504668 RepID=A0A9P4IJ78_9PEZI|nr:putative glucose dehydrogenase [Rhizodiscina lignyota]